MGTKFFILLICLFLFVSGCTHPDTKGSTSPSSNHCGTSFPAVVPVEKNPDTSHLTLSTTFPEFPKTLMAYRVVQEDPDTRMADLKKKFDINGDLERFGPEWRISIRNNSTTNVDRVLTMNLNSNGFEYIDVAREYEYNSRDLPEYLPDEGQARKIAETYIIQKGISHPGMEFEYSSHGLERMDNGSGILQTVRSDIRLNFNRTIQGIPSNDRVRIKMGGDGYVINFNEEWREIEPFKEVPLISPEIAYKELQESGLDGDITSISLEYFSGSRDSKSDYVYPAYVFRGTRWGMCSYQPSKYYVIATHSMGRTGVIREVSG